MVTPLPEVGDATQPEESTPSSEPTATPTPTLSPLPEPLASAVTSWGNELDQNPDGSEIPLDLSKLIPTELDVSAVTDYFKSVKDEILLQVQILDQNGQVIDPNSVQLIWSSDHPELISVDENGVARPLTHQGEAVITASVEGTDISASYTLSINASASSSSSGGGGGGGSYAPASEPTPDPITAQNVELSLYFEGLGVREFLVNRDRAGNQFLPNVAVDSAGQFVMAWEGAGATDNHGIFAQHFDPLGRPVGAPFQVNQTAEFRVTE